MVSDIGLGSATDRLAASVSEAVSEIDLGNATCRAADSDNTDESVIARDAAT